MTKRAPPRSGRHGWRWPAIVLAALIGLMLIAVSAWWWRPGAALDQPRRFTVAEGEGLARVAARLERDRLIPGNAASFRLFARLFGGTDAVQQGTFRLPKGASAARVLDILQHGQPVVRLVTIPEGMPSVLVQEKLAAIAELTGPAPLPPEGSVLPDSYGWEEGESRAAVVARMQKAMERTLARLWADRKGDCPVTSPQETIILASIVEKETAKADERRTVAGVYCNRLKLGMRLDADPTVIYPITQGRPLGRRIRRSELEAITGYNTYREPGLPKGPIANPGKASIAAVLDPAPTRALFFVADGTGGHVFAETLAEHEANVEKWYAIRRARGDM